MAAVVTAQALVRSAAFAVFQLLSCHIQQPGLQSAAQKSLRCRGTVAGASCGVVGHE